MLGFTGVCHTTTEGKKLITYVGEKVGKDRVRERNGSRVRDRKTEIETKRKMEAVAKSLRKVGLLANLSTSN